MMLTPLILGSGSPRRKEILSFFSIPFIQVSHPFDENSVPFVEDPKTYAKNVSQGKSLALKDVYPDQIILTADTVVYKAPKIYLKPENKEQAFQMLSELSNGWHSVFTAITLRLGETEYTESEETRVLFNPLTQEIIHKFLDSQPYQDKAGGYFIQTTGSLLARRINGCFYNVMGLPINLVNHLLTHFKINLWNFLHD